MYGLLLALSPIDLQHEVFVVVTMTMILLLMGALQTGRQLPRVRQHVHPLNQKKTHLKGVFLVLASAEEH